MSRSGLAAAWLVLVGAGGTMASFNIWHALHSGVNRELAWLVGAVIVLIIVCTSHVAATGGSGWSRLVTWGVMGAAMALSVEAVGSVVRPAFGPLWWLFPLVVDGATLVSLHAVLKPRQEQQAEEAEAPAAGQLGEQAPPPDQQQEARPEADEELREKGRAAYRASVRNGKPLSEQALGDKFGMSRSWGRNRKREVEARRIRAVA